MTLLFCRTCGDAHPKGKQCPVLDRMEDASIHWALMKEAKKKQGHQKRDRSKEFKERVKRMIWNSSKRECASCGARLNRSSAEIDHIIPVSKGGHNGFSNGQVLCKPCHKSKTKTEIDDGWTKRFRSDPSWSRRLEQQIAGVEE